MILIIFTIIFLMLFIASYYDIKTGEIPLHVTLPLIICGFVASLFPYFFPNIIIGLVFLIIGFIAYEKKLFGGGDIKLILGVILCNPLAELTIIIYWLLIASILALIVIGGKTILLKKKITEEIKFAPYLFVSFFIVVMGYIYYFVW
jgi:prepilin signal peptidase PulO-like enzyme (type II secretory pathway)